jgi:transcriptional regulator with XRE-family HTH domain
MDDLDKLKFTLGRGLLRARTRKGYTQAETAVLVGLAAAVYGRVERGGMLPSVPTLFRMCTVLGASANVLLGFSAEADVVVVAPPEKPSEDSNDSPELRRLASHLRTLSPSALRTMAALASAMRKSRPQG